MWLIIRILFAQLKGYNTIHCSQEKWNDNYGAVEKFFINTDFNTRHIDMVGHMLSWYKKR